MDGIMVDFKQKLKDLKRLQAVNPLDKEKAIAEGWNTSKLSLAVVACKGEEGIVLAHVGYHTWLILEEYDLDHFDEMGFDKPEHDGIWLWEGGLIGGEETREGGYEDVYLSGKYRELTDEELLLVGRGKRIWNEEDWWINKKEEDDKPPKECPNCQCEPKNGFKEKITDTIQGHISESDILCGDCGLLVGYWAYGKFRLNS